MADDVEVSIVIPTKNGGELFRKTLEGIRSQQTDREFETLVIDSGSSDITLELAQSFDCRILEVAPGTFNHGATRDQAIAQSSGQYIILTVQDAEPADPHWLESLVRSLEEVPHAVGAYSRQIPRPGLNPILRHRLEGWSATKTDRRIQQLSPGAALDTMAPLDKLAYVAFDNVSSCLRRSAWEDHPLGYQRFGEDVRWATLEIAQGRAIVFEPSSAVIHSHDSSVSYEFRRIFADHRNLSELLGIETVPTARHAIRNAPHARAHYLSLLEQESLSEEETAKLKKWIHGYARAENWAQFLGARMTRWARGGRVKRALGRRIEHWLGGV